MPNPTFCCSGVAAVSSNGGWAEHSRGCASWGLRFPDGPFHVAGPDWAGRGLSTYGFAAGDPVNFSNPSGLCPKEAGGNGKSEEYSDREQGTSSVYAYRASQGGSSAVNTILGWGASCGESTTCRGAAVTLAVVGGAAVAGAGEALGLNQDLRSGMRVNSESA